MAIKENEQRLFFKEKEILVLLWKGNIINVSRIFS